MSRTDVFMYDIRMCVLITLHVPWEAEYKRTGQAGKQNSRNVDEILLHGLCSGCIMRPLRGIQESGKMR